MPQVRQLERTVSLRDLSIVEMEGKMRDMSAATYDGIFVWKISDFTKKRQDAVAGRAPAMFSPGNSLLPCLASRVLIQDFYFLQ